VGRTPQELMRGWGIAPICKDSTLDHGLRIRATHNLVERGKKGRCGGKRSPAKSVETGGESLEFKKELEISVLVTRNAGEGYDTS
jgi:hypothetical protein